MIMSHYFHDLTHFICKARNSKIFSFVFWFKWRHLLKGDSFVTDISWIQSFCLGRLFSKYRGSPDSTNFGSQDNRVIRGIVLIGDWFSTKTREIDKFDLQSPLFYTNIMKTLVILFRNQYLYTILSKCLYFWPLNN